MEMIKRNDYYNLIRETGIIPRDDEYEILPLDLSKYPLLQKTKEIVDLNFIEETENKWGDYMLTGHWIVDLSYQFALLCKFDLVQVDGYSSYAYSDDQMAIFTYCEGDITLTLFTERVHYEREKGLTIKFYKEAY